MAYPTTPRLAQIIDRIILILKNVLAGDEYFYTIGENVARGLRNYTEASAFPFDCVYLGSDHKPPEYLPDHRVFRYPKFLIAGIVDEEKGEPITKMVKHLADVQKAIEADLKSTDAGSLGQLVDWGHLGSVITDEGELGLEGCAGFRQDIDVCLVGEWGEF